MQAEPAVIDKPDSVSDNMINDPENCKTVTQDSVTLAKVSVGPELQEIDSLNQVKILGNRWDSREDLLTFDFQSLVEFARELSPTKRNIIRIYSKVFDPVGVISPIFVVLKLMFQRICLERYGWDEAIPDSETAILRRWIKELQSVGQISVPRFYFVDWDGYNYDESAVLAGFGDASKLAYCAMVYIVKKAGAGGRNRVSLVTSKTRVAPVKKISTRRLELLAALIVARLITTVQQALKSVMEISKTVCFSNSMTVLYWLKRENSLKQFCDNRVKEINKTTDRDSWFHCPGVTFPDEFVNSELWFNGPKFLQESEEYWPCSDTGFEPEITEEVLKEMKAAKVLFASATKKYSLKDIINVERFSTYRKFLRTTAVVLKFVRILRNTCSKRIKIDRDIFSKDIEEAERLWIVEEQVENSTECERLEEQLGLYKDEYGVIR